MKELRMINNVLRWKGVLLPLDFVDLIGAIKSYVMWMKKNAFY